MLLTDEVNVEMATIFLLEQSYLSVNEITYGSEESIDVLGVCVDDDVADVALFDFTQDLSVGVFGRLSDVHLHVLGWWRSYQVLQPDQPLNIKIYAKIYY